MDRMYAVLSSIHLLILKVVSSIKVSKVSQIRKYEPVNHGEDAPTPSWLWMNRTCSIARARSVPTNGSAADGEPVIQRGERTDAAASLE